VTQHAAKRFLERHTSARTLDDATAIIRKRVERARRPDCRWTDPRGQIVAAYRLNDDCYALVAERDDAVVTCLTRQMVTRSMNAREYGWQA
jgi:hypothetical protein